MSNPEPPDEPDPRVLDLALKVADDARVDWAAERESSRELSDTLEQLRDIQEVAKGYRAGSGPDAVPSAAPAFQWGRLQAIEKLGEGAFGEVWRAFDPSLRREVALKLRREGDSSRGAPAWLREAQRLAKLRHPHVLAIHGADVHDGRAGIWCELLRGRTLEELLLQVGPFGAREAAHIGMDLCAALAAVHAAGLVHGDVKTRNVMREGLPPGPAAVEGAGRIVLMDFGAAAERGDAETPGSPSAGTPLYSAPELLAGADASVASDLYALGVLLYRLVTARYPIDATSMAELRERHAHGPAALREVRPDLPAAFVHVVERALARDPSLRYRSAADMERALAGALGAAAPDRAASRTSRAWVAVAFAAGALAVAAAWIGAPWIARGLRPRFRLDPRGQEVAVTTRQVFDGRERLAQFGYATSVGDVTGDGFPDLFVGSPKVARGEGRAYLHRGLASGGFGEGEAFAPEPPFGGFGFVVTPIGDVNGDGEPDFAVSSVDEGFTGRTPERVHLYWGGSKFDLKPDLVLQATRPMQAFGFGVAGAGDFDGDGFGDLVVGAPGDDAAGARTGRVFVYFGGPRLDAKADLELSSVEPSSQYGITVAGLGDFNGDGAGDIAVGADWDNAAGPKAGRVFVYFGGAGFDARPDLVLSGPAPMSAFGHVRALGDFNADGFADLGVAAPWADGFEHGSGAAYVYYGGQHPSDRPGLVLRGGAEGTWFGIDLGACGDLNGDRYADLVVGATVAADGGPGGSAYVYFGGPGMDDRPDLRLKGRPEDVAFGRSVCAYADTARGAFGSVVIGAGGQWARGGVYVFDFARHTFLHPVAGERWRAGERRAVTWLGAARANLAISRDGGASWRDIARDVGGAAQNRLEIVAPDSAGPIRLRLVPVDGRLRGSAVSGDLEILPSR